MKLVILLIGVFGGVLGLLTTIAIFYIMIRDAFRQRDWIILGGLSSALLLLFAFTAAPFFK